jgi:hypothetical protein
MKNRLSKSDYPTIALALRQYHRELNAKPSTQGIQILMDDIAELFDYFNDKSDEQDKI